MILDVDRSHEYLAFLYPVTLLHPEFNPEFPTDLSCSALVNKDYILSNKAVKMHSQPNRIFINDLYIVRSDLEISLKLP